MTIQQIADKISEKQNAVRALLAKDEVTDEDNTLALKLGDEIKSLQTEQEKLQRVAELKQSVQNTVVPPVVVEPTQTKSETIVTVKNTIKPKFVKDATDAYKLGLFYAKAAGFDVDEKLQAAGVQFKTQSEGNAALGGYLVPSELSGYIIDLVEQYGVFPQYARTEPMGSDTKEIIIMGDSFSAAWGSEAGSMTADDETFGRVTLSAKKLYGYAQTTVELEEDSIVSIGDVLTSRMARAMAYKIDQAGFNGDGTQPYGHIVGLKNAVGAGSTATAATNNDTFAEITVSDIVEGIGMLPSYARANTRIFCSNAVKANVFTRLAMAAGGASAAEYISTGIVSNFFGIPIVEVNVMPTTDSASQIYAYVGDLSQAATMGVRRGVTVSRDTSKGFDTDTIYYKATQRVDINCHSVGTASAAGAIVALKSAS